MIILLKTAVLDFLFFQIRFQTKTLFFTVHIQSMFSRVWYHRQELFHLHTLYAKGIYQDKKRWGFIC